MADFVPSQKYASDFNKAKKYENGDAVQAETVNNLIEGQLFVQGIATNQPKVVEDGTEGSPTVYFENKDGLQRFVFKNIRGQRGGKGDDGDDGNIMRFVDGPLSVSNMGNSLNLGIDHILNPQNISVGDIVFDPYFAEGGNGYLCIWEVTQVHTNNSVDLKGLGYVLAPKGVDGKTPYIDGGYWYIDGNPNSLGKAEGFSPTIDVEKEGDEYYIYITDARTVGKPDPIIVKEGKDGVGIKSIDQTTENTGSSELNTIKVYDDNNKEIGSFNIRNGAKGASVNRVTSTPVANGTQVNVYLDTNISTPETSFIVNDGNDGISPVISVAKQNGATTITMTDINGSKTATINDGENGVSVTSIKQTTTSTSSGGVNKITATLSNGTTSEFQIMNGAKGQDGEDGKDGKSPTISVNPMADGAGNELVITNPDLSVTRVEILNGSTPYIQDGYWYINGTNLNVKARGDDGVGIESTLISYKIDTQGQTAPTSGWGVKIPTLEKGKYLWTRTVVNYSNYTSSTSYNVSYIGVDGFNPTVTSTDITQAQGGKEITFTYKDSTGATKQEKVEIWNGDPAVNAETASKLAESRKISLGGDLSGSANFDGSQDITISATVKDDSHSHSNYSLKTNTANSISVSWGSFTGINPFVLNLALKDVDGNVISTATLDLPLEQIVVSGEYNPTTGNIELLTKEGKIISVPVSDLVEGLVNTTTFNTTVANIENGSIVVGKAKVLNAERKITLSGDVSGSVSFDGSKDVTITTTVADDSHNHIISNIDGLQVALDNKANKSELHNGTLTIKRNGTTIQTFTANNEGNVVADISVPTADDIEDVLEEWSKSLDKGDVGLDKVDNVKQYSASNPPPYPVTSVAGKTGAVTLAKGDVGLGSVVNTGDSATPVSGGTTKFTTGGAYTELAKKVDKSTTVNGHALSGNVTVTASDVGLGNVDNKSSDTIRSEITKSNVTTALGYTPPTLSQVQSDTDSRIETYANNNIVGVYAEKKNGVYYVEGTGTTAGVWLGTNNEISSYYNGLTIAYKVGIAGAENLTLNINGLGAKSVVRNASSAVTTHYGVGSVVLLVYTTDDGTSYWKVADYDSDTKTRSSNKASTKMYVIGAQTQSTSGQTTYSNSKVYIGTDNCLYSNGSKVGLASDITTNANNISSLTTTVNGKADITTVNAIAGTANTNAQAIENIAPRLQDVETEIATFKGNSSVTGSIDQKISSAINDFANSATANGTIDTFKELVDYVAEHGSEVEEITGDITDLKGRMSTAETNIGKKANQTSLDTTNTNVSNLSTTVTNLSNNKADKSSLSAYALKSTVESLSGEVSANSTRIGEVEQRSTSIENDITDNVKPSITGVTNRVASVEDRATALENGKVDKVTGKGLSTNDYTTDDKKKLSGIASGAEVNQDAFSNVKVGTTTISADSKTDTIELANGSNITITADDTNDKVTIAVSSDFANKVSTLENDITKINTFEEKLDAKADKSTDLIDNSVVYVKSVPLNVAPYAEILSIDSAVTSVKSVGKNLFNIVGKDFSNTVSLGSMHGQKINATYKENTQYTFSWVSTCTWANSSSTYLYMRVYYTDGTNSGYSYYVARQGDNKRRYTWTTASGKTVNYIQFTYSDEGTFLFEDAQLVEGTSIMSPYAPKFEEILTPTNIANGNNVIKVEGGGTLTFVNASSTNVESSVKYYINANQEISANKFVGDLLGTSKISGSAMYATPSTDDNSIDMRITKAQSLVDNAVDTALDAYNKATKGIKKAYTQYTSGAGSAGTFHLYLQLQDNTTIEVENFSSDMEGFIMDVFMQNQ